MKIYRTKSGPFAEKPFFSANEVERLCNEELQKYNLFPSDPAPIRIDRFVEKRFKIQPRYEQLPDGLLGFTLFGRNGVKEIVVSQGLDEEGTKHAERRLRTTLAHESGHGLLHTHLFVFGARPESLFDDDGLEADKPKILCRENGEAQSGKKSQYRWWEYQANLAMGALLLPRPLVEKAIASLLTSRGQLGLTILQEENRKQAIKRLSDIFDVNPIVARIRLDGLYPAANENQLTL